MITLKRPETEPDGEPEKKKSNSSCLGIIIIAIAAFFIIPTITWQNSRRFYRHSGQFTTCQSNLKNIGTALEMYSTDYKGHYPPSLNALTPNYIKQIPTCPSSGTNNGYIGSYVVAQSPDAYTVCCAGSYHGSAGTPANYPMYDSFRGLTAKP
jgi:hypothetical protein